MWVCVNDQGTAIGETALTESEYWTAALRLKAELRALASGDCSRVSWAFVSDNDALN